MNILHFVCYNADVLELDATISIIKLLLKEGVDVNSTDDLGYFPISYLLEDQNEKTLPLVKLLVESGADIIENENVCKFFDHYVFPWGDEIAKYLLERGFSSSVALQRIEFGNFEDISIVNIVLDNVETSRDKLFQMIVRYIECDTCNVAKELIKRCDDLQELMVYLVIDEQYHCSQIHNIFRNLKIFITLEDRETGEFLDPDVIVFGSGCKYKGRKITIPVKTDFVDIQLSKFHKMKWVSFIYDYEWEEEDGPRVRLAI